MKTSKTLLSFAALFLALAMISGLSLVMQAQAAPAPIVTPVGNPDARANAVTALYPVTFMDEKLVTADGRGTTFNLANYGILDLQYIIDQGSPVNTTTLTIQYSCDGVNWVDGANLVSANAADAVGLTQLNNYCRYTNIYANVTNTETVTVTVIAVAK